MTEEVSTALAVAGEAPEIVSEGTLEPVPEGVPHKEWVYWKLQFRRAYSDFQVSRFKAVYLLWQGFERFGECVWQVVSELGVTEHTVENWLRVAKYIPEEQYRPSLPFSAHVLVAKKSLPLAKRVEYLDWAEANSATYEELKNRIKQDAGEPEESEYTQTDVKDWMLLAFMYLNKCRVILEGVAENELGSAGEGLAGDIAIHLRRAEKFPWLKAFAVKVSEGTIDSEG